MGLSRHKTKRLLMAMMLFLFFTVCVAQEYEKYGQEDKYRSGTKGGLRYGTYDKVGYGHHHEGYQHQDGGYEKHRYDDTKAYEGYGDRYDKHGYPKHDDGYGKAACFTKPSSPNGDISCVTPAAPGATCTGRCDNGRAFQATCSATGKWTVADSACLEGPATTCPAKPDNPTNGGFTSCASSAVGATCDGTCDDSGTLSAVCNNAGSWVLVNECVSAATTCPAKPDNPKNGDFTSCASSAVGATCDGTCDDSGTLSAVCNNAGSWVLVNECVSAGTQCTEAPSSESGTFDDCIVPLDPGVTCVGTCASNSGTLSATCTNTGSWQYSVECSPGTQCTEAPSSGSGTFDACSVPADPGATCGGTCTTGSGTLSATCSDTGNWEFCDKCGVGTCFSQPSVTQSNLGTFNCKLPAAEGVTCVGQCFVGGTLSADCLADGSWQTTEACDCTAENKTCLPYNYNYNYEDTCCDGSTCQDVTYYDYACCDENKFDYGSACTENTDCCSGVCELQFDYLGNNYYYCDYVVDYAVQGEGAGAHAERASALSGSTHVHTLESATPVPLSALKIGDHIPCAGSMNDLALSQTTRWCKVMNFVVARDKSKHRKLNFTKPGSDKPDSLLLHPRQLLYRLSSSVVAVDDKAPPAVTTPNTYTAVTARRLKAGDKILVKSTSNDLAAGFVLATVNHNQKARRAASYKPVVDAPVMVLGGVALATFDAPKMGGKNTTKPTDTEARSAAMAQRQLMAPLYTQHLQPVGTPASKVVWEGAVGDTKGSSGGVWSLWEPIMSHIRTLVSNKDTKGLDSIHKWFADSQATKKGGISAEDVADILKKTAPPAMQTKAPENPRPVHTDAQAGAQAGLPPKPEEPAEEV